MARDGTEQQLMRALAATLAFLLCAVAGFAQQGPPPAEDCEPRDDQTPVYVHRTSPPRLYLCGPGGWSEVPQQGATGPQGEVGPAGPQGDPGPPGAGLPAGAIILWSGPLASIPAGWALCDGTNGTPDLRDRFVRGASSGAGAGATGGTATHDHSYSDVVAHTHGASINDPGHAHVENNNSATTGGLSGWTARDTSTSTPLATGYSTAAATTGVTVTTAAPAGSVATGTTQVASSLPPYYALLYLMKL